jgi:hypothetical protein
MTDESKPDSQFAKLLKQLFTAPPPPPAENSEKPRNLLQTFATLGSELKRQAQSAGSEFRQHMAEVRRNAPPMRIDAQPAVDIGWTHDPEAVRRIQALERAGYVQEGVIELAQLPHYATISFRHPGRDTAAFISKTSKGISFELETHDADGRIFELCDATPPAGLGSPPWMTRRFHPERTPDELIAAQDSERPPGTLVPLEPGQAIHWVEAGFARIQAWRADRGGWTREEICRQRGWTQSALTPEQSEALEGARHENIERWLFNWLRLQPGLPHKPDALEDSLVIVSEDMTPDTAMVAWAGGTGDPDIGRARTARIRLNPPKDGSGWNSGSRIPIPNTSAAPKPRSWPSRTFRTPRTSPNGPSPIPRLTSASPPPASAATPGTRMPWRC